MNCRPVDYFGDGVGPDEAGIHLLGIDLQRDVPGEEPNLLSFSLAGSFAATMISLLLDADLFYEAGQIERASTPTERTR